MLNTFKRFFVLLSVIPVFIASSIICAAASPLLQKALKGPLKGTDNIIFAVRSPGNDPHWYANFGYWSSDKNKMMYGRPGGRLCKFNIKTKKLTLLIDDPAGAVRDPTLHYNGKTILFSYRRGKSKYYNLYEIGTDGKGLRQITKDPFDDIEPKYLPSDEIVFGSSRCKRWVSCWHTQVAILYRCNRNGQDIKQISGNIEHDNTPSVLPDGRILFTRWEYIDRSQVAFHHLWVMNPDGTGQMVFFGNQAPGTLMIDSKPIPGSRLVASIFSPGHGRTEHVGRLMIVNTEAGPSDMKHAWPVKGCPGFIRDPYPLSRHCFLAAQGPRLLLIDSTLQRNEALYKLGPKDRTFGLEIHEPVPVRPRNREPLIPDRIKWSDKNGFLVLQNLLDGRDMKGVKTGEIKKLLVVETLPKPANFSGGPEEISWLGSFNLERILGTVPVEPDGSAYMELPANRSLFFVALDEKDLSVKRMQSFLSVMPGETTSCVGCHEQRVKVPRNSGKNVLLALEHPPRKITPFRDIPDVFDFPRDIQPILDKHCVKCHNYDKRCGYVLLTGDLGIKFSHSFWDLMAFKQVADGENGYGNRSPRTIGSSASPLMKKIDGSHYGVNVSRREWNTIRLWIEAGATYAGTYAALGVPPTPLGPILKVAGPVFQRRCYKCHSFSDRKRLPLIAKPLHAPFYKRVVEKNDPIQRVAADILINFSRPEKSPLLLGPLSKKAGGYGTCNGKLLKYTPYEEGKKITGPGIFKDTSDPDYQRILSAIKKVKPMLNRFELAGFKPNPAYIRELKRFNVLPKSFDPLKDKIDGYKTDRAYWRSLWHKPAKKSPPATAAKFGIIPESS